MTCISNSVLLVVLGFLLFRSTTLAVTSTSKSSATEINPSTIKYESGVEKAQRSTTASKVRYGDDSIDVEVKVANSGPSANKGRPPGTGGRVPLPPVGKAWDRTGFITPNPVRTYNGYTVIEPKTTDRPKSQMLYGKNPYYSKKDSFYYDDDFNDAGDVDEDGNEQSMPPFGQYLSQISGSGNVIVSKVFTCDNNDDFNLSLSQISDGRTLNASGITDPGVKRYLNKSLYTQQLISHSIRSDVDDPLIEQSASQCSGSRIVEGARIIFDCPAWCGKPISVKQSASQVSSSSFSQIMELYTVCPKGTVPRITYSKKSSQISGRIAQNFKSIALYPVKK